MHVSFQTTVPINGDDLPVVVSANVSKVSGESGSLSVQSGLIAEDLTIKTAGLHITIIPSGLSREVIEQLEEEACQQVG